MVGDDQDNSSSAGPSLSETTGSFPLLRTTRYSARSPSRTSFPSLKLFLPGTTTNHSHVASIQRKIITVDLSRLFLLLPLHLLPPMKKLVFRCLMHQIV